MSDLEFAEGVLIGEDGPDLWKPKEVAEKLKVHPRAIYAWVLAGKVKALRTPGNHIRIPASEVKRLLSTDVEETQQSPLT